MTPLFPAVFMSFLAPALISMLLFGALAWGLGLNPRHWKWFLGSAIVSVGILAVPVGGLPVARWLAGIVDHWSVTMVALFGVNVVRLFFGFEIFRRRDWLAAEIFGAAAGVLLYPMALGLGSMDPYGLGWYFGPLFVAVALVTVILLWNQNRFGLVLTLAMACWLLGVPESRNYWDSLIDPIYFLLSVGALLIRWGRAVRKA